MMIAEGEFVKAERLVSGALRILDDGDEKALLAETLDHRIAALEDAKRPRIFQNAAPLA